MNRKNVDSLGNERRVHLYLSASFADAWENLLLPWFESIAGFSPTPAPCAVVTPFRSQAYLLRSKLLAKDISILGLEFLSPAQLREKLVGRNRQLPLREHLRFLLAIAAGKIAARSGENEKSLVAKSVERDPDHFLRAIDQLSAAGWTSEEIGDDGLREVAQAFEKTVRQGGFEFVHAADRQALSEVAKSPPVFEQLLLLGFDAAHWPLWPLLRTAVTASSQATVLLSDPRDEARDLDETWVGTWEEIFGAAQPIAGAERAADSRLENLRRLPETPSEKIARGENPIEPIHFLIGRDTSEQAKAIVALTAKFLQDENCERVGILFPRAGALARIVAKLFETARIAHNDGIGHFGPSVFDDDAWRAWLELQQSPRLKILMRFLRTTSAQIFEELSVAEAEEILQRAYADVLVDNIDLLRKYCLRKADAKRPAMVARGLEKIHFLPGSATLSEFLAATRKIFRELDWKQRWNEIDRLSRSWAGDIGEVFSKNLYLRWLGEVLGAPSLHRDDYGSHVYSRIHLLPYAEAEGQSWSHLIFAGLNEEAWPALDDELGFVREQEIDEFNRQNKILNRRARKPGRQGEGQWSVREDKTLLLGATERRQIRRRQLTNLVEAVTQEIGVTANLYSEASPSRIANPSELFSRLYLSARGAGVSQQTLLALEKQTRAWLHHWSPIDAQKIDSVSLGRTRYAYDARRQLRAASEYEFALRAPPDRPISLRVTQWEQVLRSPALIWMKVFLDVEADDENGNPWAIATGQWVHRWLAEGTMSSRGERGTSQEIPRVHSRAPSTSARDDNAPSEIAPNEFVAIPSPNEIRTRILESARQFRTEVQQLCDACAQPLPDWWASGWSNALYLADSLAAKLDRLSDWSHLAAEWKLAAPTTIPLEAEETLRVRGRIDLILARGKRTDADLAFPDLWIVDYKTGRQRGFDLRARKKNESAEEKFRKQLIDGRGVQLALYALAAHSLGAAHARLTLLGIVGELDPQFQLEDALAQKEFWHELHRMQESGIFGMLGNLHNKFGFGRAYPLATLAVDPDLLREKWALTHPSLAIETEEPERD